MKRAVLAVLLLPVLAFLAVYVWPTRYRYSAGSNTKPRVLLVRVDRFTGAAEMLNTNGWHSCVPHNPWLDSPFQEPAGIDTMSFSEISDYKSRQFAHEVFGDSMVFPDPTPDTTGTD